MAYITSTDLGTYLLAKGFVTTALSAADQTRLLNTAIGEWEMLVGVKPFLALSSTKMFDPTDIQADRRGWILDLSTPLSAAPTLIKTAAGATTSGTTLVQYDDWVLPDYSAPYNQIIFFQRPIFRLNITAPWGYMDSASIGDLVNDAIYCLAAARVVEEQAGAQGNQTKVKTGLVEVTLDDPVPTLRKRAKELARMFILS
jgi:hypothetical protein